MRTCVAMVLAAGGAASGQVVFLGSFDGHDYFLTEESLTVFQARVVAAQLADDLGLSFPSEVHLTAITSEEENAFIASFGAHNWWIGLSDQQREGTFLWDSGEAFDYESWAPGEPNNLDNEDHVVMWSGGGWNDDQGNKLFPGIIEVTTSTQGPPVEVVNAFANLSFDLPVDLKDPGDGSGRLVVVEKRGVISIFANDPEASVKTPFLDLTDRVEEGEEFGILGVVFHPDYETNGHVYVSYTVSDPEIVSIVSRFTVSDDPDVLDVDSEVVMLEVGQPIPNHNMHRLDFGPDGYLYVSVGDGGCCGDPLGVAQDLTDLKGSILRLDVDGALPYEIPEDNPFAGNDEGWREEIFAYGLRNPWRFSFDAEGRLWCGDVGQDAWEEINWIESGGNYGWPIMEGLHCYDPPRGCEVEGLELPVWEHAHEFNPTGLFSVTGGHVFEGSTCARLSGKYVYGGFATGNIFAMAFDAGGAVEVETVVAFAGLLISGWGVDASGELYGLDYSGGRVFQLACACEADVNEDGELNVLDFVAFQELWQAGDPLGDCDGNGVFNVLDFVCYQLLFVEGCG